MIAPGKYDDYAEHIAQEQDAAGVVLLVIEGNRGNGLSLRLTQELAAHLPEIMDQFIKLAKDSIKRDAAAARLGPSQ
jgi:hypothetical protein